MEHKSGKIAQVKDYLDYKNIDVEILSLKDIDLTKKLMKMELHLKKIHL
ncbi:MAG: hypothetical protein ACLU2J_02420 [Clostridia bacterium]